MKIYCIYREKESDGFGTMWKTNCGEKIYMQVPCEVGISFAPLPTDDGKKFCTYCGNVIN